MEWIGKMNSRERPTDTRALNLLEKVDSSDLKTELVEILASGKNIRVERIISEGHCSESGFWYDDPSAEWVTVLSGEAQLRFEVDKKLVHLRQGDHITIAPHEKHRVEWTTPDEQTVWLAVYFLPLSSNES